MSLLLLGLLACAGPPAEPDATAGSRRDINVALFHEIHEEGVLVIDVREPDEYALGHVPGARNVPLGALTADHPAVAGLGPDDRVYLICESGRRSAVAADRLAAAGFRTLTVKGGTANWRAMSLALER